MREEDEIKLYHIICDISKICRNYFYGRKYLPRDFWSEEDEIKSLISTSKVLKDTYNDIKKKMKENS